MSEQDYLRSFKITKPSQLSQSKGLNRFHISSRIEILGQILLLGLLIAGVLFTIYFYYMIFEGILNNIKNP